MGNTIDKATKSVDFIWVETDEPHATRRKQIMAKYPEVRELFGHDWTGKYVTLWWVLSQLFLALFVVPNQSWWLIVALAYAYGSIVGHALFLAMHEISHNLMFKSGVNNRLFGVFANLVTIVPHFSMFTKYHMEHHQYQGVENVDVDIPSRQETYFFANMIGKILWVILMPAFYVVRPLLIKPKTPGFWEMINWSVCLSFDFAIWYYFGWKPLAYMFMSSIFGAGLHPVAGHFIAEHYVFLLKHETYSYYGPLNFLSFFVGFHNEHHDFPRVPGSRLHLIRQIAPEFYDDLPCHTSWVKVVVDYIMDPTVGPWSRVMRKRTKEVPL